MDSTQLDTLMMRLGTTPLTRAKVLRGLVVSAAALAGLPTLGAWPAQALEDREQELQRTLDMLRTDIATYVPHPLLDPFLAQVDAVKPLLLPAVQMAREAARRKACAAVHILTALRLEAETAAASDRFNDDHIGFEIVIADIDVLLRLIVADRELSRRC